MKKIKNEIELTPIKHIEFTFAFDLTGTPTITTMKELPITTAKTIKIKRK